MIITLRILLLLMLKQLLYNLQTYSSSTGFQLNEEYRVSLGTLMELNSFGKVKNANDGSAAYQLLGYTRCSLAGDRHLGKPQRPRRRHRYVSVKNANDWESAAYQYTVALAGHLGVATVTEDRTEMTQSLSEKVHAVHVSRKWLCCTHE